MLIKIGDPYFDYHYHGYSLFLSFDFPTVSVSSLVLIIGMMIVWAYEYDCEDRSDQIMLRDHVPLLVLLLLLLLLFQYSDGLWKLSNCIKHKISMNISNLVWLGL